MHDPASLVLSNYTVSGFSSGANLALIHFVAYSASVDGVGILGGSPYGCQLIPNPQYSCSGMKVKSADPDPNIQWDDFGNHTFYPYLLARQTAQLIDPLAGLAGSRAYLYSGLNDKDVFQPVMYAVAAQLCNLSVDRKAIFNVPSAHAWIVDDVTCGAPGRQRLEHCCGSKKPSTTCRNGPGANFSEGAGCCGRCNDGGKGSSRTYWKPPINNCGYDMASDMLQYLLRGNTSGFRGVASQLNLLAFDQRPFLLPGWHNATDAGFAERGFVYVPAGCYGGTVANVSCRVHVHYHPCGGNYDFLNTSYMLENGIASFAEVNNLVVLWPQASTKRPGDLDPGCWDWYGGISDEFDTRNGVQVKTVHNMVSMLPRIIGAGMFWI